MVSDIPCECSGFLAAKMDALQGASTCTDQHEHIAESDGKHNDKSKASHKIEGVALKGALWVIVQTSRGEVMNLDIVRVENLLNLPASPSMDYLSHFFSFGVEGLMRNMILQSSLQSLINILTSP